MAVNDILEIGRQGLTANRQALQTTSSNITNANTPGYSRRRAVMENANLPAAGGRLQGSGVDVSKVVRVHDDFVQKQIVEESQALGGLKMRSEHLKRIESLMTKDGEHLNDLVNKFFNDVRQLSTNPETSTLRNIVAESATSLAQGFRRMNDSIENMRHELDLRVGDTVDQINTMTKEIAGLNDAIATAETRGDIPNELYDRRDEVMRNLGTKLDFQTATDQRGQVTIIAAGTALVQGNDAHNLTVMRTPPDANKAAGSVDIFVTNAGAGRSITTGIKDGELGGLLHVRDQVLMPAQQHLDTLAYQLATSVNGVHREGAGLDGASGRDLFSNVGQAAGAAHAIDVSDDIKKNHELIAAGHSADTPGDNQIALKIADLQNQKMLPIAGQNDSQHSTINESINSLMGNIGTQTAREDSFFQHQQAVMDQLNNYRESLSGVNLEEEAVNMIQYQTVFNASAKAMKVGEELFDTILKLKD